MMMMLTAYFRSASVLFMIFFCSRRRHQLYVLKVDEQKMLNANVFPGLPAKKNLATDTSYKRDVMQLPQNKPIHLSIQLQLSIQLRQPLSGISFIKILFLCDHF